MFSLGSKEKEREGKSIYIAPFISVTHSLNMLRYGSHSFNCKLHHACQAFARCRHP